MDTHVPAPPIRDQGDHPDSGRAPNAASWRPMSFKAFLRLSGGFGTAKETERTTD